MFTVKFEDSIHNVSLSELDTTHSNDVALFFVCVAHDCQRTSCERASVRACERASVRACDMRRASERACERASVPPASAACHVLVHGGSTSRLLCAKPAAPPQLGENEHDDRHVPVESHVVITTDTHPINSRARGAGWVAWFGLPLRERPCLGGKCQQARGCSWAFATMLRSS